MSLVLRERERDQMDACCNQRARRHQSFFLLSSVHQQHQHQYRYHRGVSTIMASSSSSSAAAAAAVSHSSSVPAASPSCLISTLHSYYCALNRLIQSIQELWLEEILEPWELGRFVSSMWAATSIAASSKVNEATKSITTTCGCN